MIVWVEEVMAVGVPLMAPVVLENARPTGSDGETVQVGVPPLVVGMTVVIAVPFVNVSELGST